jgi:hypothetical protein
MTDRAIGQAGRVRLAAARDELAHSGLAPRAVAYLDAALAPGVAPTTVRDYLIETRHALVALDDDRVAPVLREIGAAMAHIRPHDLEPTVTPGNLPSLTPLE